METFMHQEVLKATKATMGVVHYMALGCDEVSTMDNQSWLATQYYIM
jgi:hypothetical protein